MRIVEITWQHRNDFHWIGQCEFCGHRERYGDGYADAFYQQRVVPDRKCVSCGQRSNGRGDPPALSPQSEDLKS